MATSDKQSSGWGAFMLILALVGLVAIWAFLPLKVMEATWKIEQSRMAVLAGSPAGEWIAEQSARWLSDSAATAEKFAASFRESPPENWLMERTVVSLVWLRLSIHRTFTLLLWSLIGLPLILAAAADGFLVREVRKHSFVAQSPIRHKMGVRFLTMAIWVALLWLMVPVPAPVLIAPGVIVFMAIAFWMWGSNLQKRI